MVQQFYIKAHVAAAWVTVTKSGDAQLPVMVRPHDVDEYPNFLGL